MANPLALVLKNGSALAVLRPADPALALESSRAAAGNKEAFDAVLTEQKYTFLGLLRKDQKIVDPKTRKPIDRIKPGDSFVSWKQFKKAYQAGVVTTLPPNQGTVV